MEWELGSADPVVHGLRNYVRGVVKALGQSGGSYAQSEPLSVYLAVDGHLPDFPQRDVALLWEERHGWGFALETGCGEDLLITSYLGTDPLPPPEEIATYLAAILRGRTPGQLEPPEFPVADVRRGLRLHARNAAFAGGGDIPEQRLPLKAVS